MPIKNKVLQHTPTNIAYQTVLECNTQFQLKCMHFIQILKSFFIIFYNIRTYGILIPLPECSTFGWISHVNKTSLFLYT